MRILESKVYEVGCWKPFARYQVDGTKTLANAYLWAWSDDKSLNCCVFGIERHIKIQWFLIKVTSQYTSSDFALRIYMQWQLPRRSAYDGTSHILRFCVLRTDLILLSCSDVYIMCFVAIYYQTLLIYSDPNLAWTLLLIPLVGEQTSAWVYWYTMWLQDLSNSWTYIWSVIGAKCKSLLGVN